MKDLDAETSSEEKPKILIVDNDVFNVDTLNA